MAVEAFVHCQYDDDSGIYIAEAKGTDPNELYIAAQSTHDVLTASWQKFVDAGHITAMGLAKKIAQPFTQAERMAEGSARYFLAYDGERTLEDPDQVRGFARIETYQPRNVFRRSYPNVTDLEFRSGQLDDETTARDARTLLYHALHHYELMRRVAVYTEEPNQSGRSFFTEHGFMERRVLDPEIIDEDSKISYVHMEAPSQPAIYQTYPGGEHRFSYM
jgi:hypothetical protein